MHTVLSTLARYYDMLRASPRLQWLHVHSAGADRPIFAELLARGVRVTTSARANAAPVAQIGGLLHERQNGRGDILGGLNETHS
jgi:phosphoglycerate dehydrogenase-like enzyme